MARVRAIAAAPTPPFARRAGVQRHTAAFHAKVLFLVQSAYPPGTEAAIRDGRISSLTLSGNLEEIAARVIQNGGCHRSHERRLLRKANAEPAQPFVLTFDVIHCEGGEGDAVLNERGFERLGGWVLVGLENQLNAVGIVGGPRRSASGADLAAYRAFS